MKEFQTVYLPIGVPTFHLESARKEFRDCAALLGRICGGTDSSCCVPEDILLSLESLHAFMDELTPDLIILQNVTFAKAS